MRQLDRSRPYSEVIGRPGVAFEQDGVNFRSDGSEAVERPILPPEPRPVAKPAPAAKPARKPALKASTVLAAQFGGEEFAERFGFSEEPTRDVLAGYRDPQNADGSMVIAPRAWVDGV